MRAGVVLYGEPHPRGDDIGRVVERDMRGGKGRRKGRVAKKEESTGLESGLGVSVAEAGTVGSGLEGEVAVGEQEEVNEGKADILIVVGTSLAIPGTKTIVREFGRAVGGGKIKPPLPSLDSTSALWSVGAKKKSKAGPNLERVKTILLNLTPLAKPAETEGIFDVFVQGDVQVFVEEYLAKARAVVPKPRVARKPKATKSLPTPTWTPPQLQLPNHLDDNLHSLYSSQSSSSTNTSFNIATPLDLPLALLPTSTPTSSIPSSIPSPFASTPTSSFSWDSASPATCYVEIEADDGEPSSAFKTPSKPKRERSWEGDEEEEEEGVEESPTKGAGTGISLGLGQVGSGKPKNWEVTCGGGRSS